MDNKKGIKKEVKLYFVIPKGNNPDNASDVMKMAFQHQQSDDINVVDHIAEAESKEAALSPQWKKESECLNIPPSKNTVFVLQEFNCDSEVFKKLRSTKSLVVGPMCLRSCLAENKPIPDNKSPVFTAAMRDIVVTASQISVEVKADIKEKVSFMGGCYLSNLSEPVTHLVTNAVRSAKYEVAAERGLPIMKVEWVEAVWRESQTRNIKASDPAILAEYKCPVFYNMFIACSNLSKKEKEEIKMLVTKYGGTFTPQMRQTETTLLVLREPQGLKYTHARSWDLPCVKPSYIYESVEKGYAVPSKGHLVEPTVQCSTPTKEDNIANFTYNSDPSISVINFEINKTHVDETQTTNITQLGSQQRQPQRSSGSQYTQILNNLTISDAKKAGSFVDGCKVYLSGFAGLDGEKLVRILSLGGATVFTELTESVSHVLLGEFLVDDVRALAGLAQKPHVVSLEWLVASMQQKAPAAEEPYYCLETRNVAPEPPSPLSQKGLQLLKPQPGSNETSMMPPPPEPTVNRKLFSEFMKENVKSPAKQQPPSTPSVEKQNQSVNSSNLTEESSIAHDLFLGKKFLIVGYSSELTERLEEMIDVSGGTVVAANFKGVADYAVVPLDTPVPNITALEVVTYLWVEECVDSKEVVEMQYYHQPFSTDPDKQPLAACCLSFSSYCGQEKTFLIHLAQALGAVYQDILVKVAKKRGDEELQASTHLVCPAPQGKKYEAAARWGLAIVTKDWLLACARTGSRVPETGFAVAEDGDTSRQNKTPGTATKQGRNTADSGFETPKPSSSLEREANVAFKTPNNPPVMPAGGSVAVGSPATPALPRPAGGSSVLGSPATPALPRPAGGLSAVASPATPALPHPAVNSLKRKSCAMTPDDQSPFHVSTPDTPYGQFIGTPTAETKKRWKKFIEDFPIKPNSPPASPKNARRQSTPLSELKRRAFAKALETSEENVNPNYSIEEMEEEPVSANPSNLNQTPLRENVESPKPIAQFSKKKADGNTSKAAAGWSTPSAGDFRSNSEMSSSHKKVQKPSPPEKRSLENELVCQMLGQLQQRLSSTPTQSGNEQRVHRNYKHLASQPTSSSAGKLEAHPLLDPESQPILVDWEEPVETAEKARMSSISSPTKKPRKFVLSNVVDKEIIEEKLSRLGEALSSGVEFDQDTTHLVVDKPVRSEKLLCCLAGGRWVLHTSFIDRMVLSGKYVPEEEKYEWGNPASSGRLPSLPPGDIGNDLAAAAYRWRKKVGETSDGAFKGMKAMLFTTPAKSGSYQRLITAGGGVVLPSILTSVRSATHCFVELNKVPSLTVPLSEFAAHNVPCLPPVFLGEMLTSPNPNVEKSLIPEYSRLLALKN